MKKKKKEYSKAEELIDALDGDLSEQDLFDFSESILAKMSDGEIIEWFDFGDFRAYDAGVEQLEVCDKKELIEFIEANYGKDWKRELRRRLKDEKQ